LRVVAHIAPAADGKLAGSLDSPDQGASDIAIDSLTYKEAHLHFAIASLGSSYEGTMSCDSAKITGEWKQSGLSLPLVFNRRGK
jgi:uncharacterized protein